MDAYIGEIRLFAGTFAPTGWHFCDGSTLSLNDYQMLYALIGTTYGGDGQSTFNLPDLRCRVPVGVGTRGPTTLALNQSGGQDAIQLTEANLPSHSHQVYASTNQANQTVPQPGNTLGSLTEPQRMYIDTSKATGSPSPYNAKVIGNTGGNQPYFGTVSQAALYYIICITGGLFPNFP